MVEAETREEDEMTRKAREAKAKRDTEVAEGIRACSDKEA